MAASLFLSLLDLTTKILSSIPLYLPSSSSSSKSSLAPTLTKEITKLDRTLRGIQAVLADAEEREIRDGTIKHWLFELKQVTYSAEEVLEDFSYELQKWRSHTNLLVNASGSYDDCNGSKQKQELVSFSRLDEPSFIEDLLNRIREVKNDVDDIRRDRDHLSLKEHEGVRLQVESHTSRDSSSLIDSFQIYGRENEKNQIISALLEPSSMSGGFSGCGIETISIIGMGGIGKTTLARLVYNNKTVENHFKLRSWVWVSEVYDEVRLTKAIIESTNGEPCYLDELDTLQMKLKEILDNKLFLLVLDDIWNEDPIRWDTLKKPLFAGANGSTVIITTRNNNVALITAPKLTLHTKGLEIEDSWALFCHFAFQGKSVQNACPSLVTIGHNIVIKSEGVPLVVRLIGSILSLDACEESWINVLENDLWELDEGKNFILPVLKLSYQHLPSPLKTCFAYCASFPKGFRFDIDDLVRMWDALGLIPSNRSNDSTEIGISFVHDLISRSFFQITIDMNSNKIITMHDLIHDLASMIAGDECVTLENNNNSTNLTFTRHLRHFYGCYSFLPSDGNFVLRSFYSTIDLSIIQKLEEVSDLSNLLYRSQILDNPKLNHPIPYNSLRDDPLPPLKSLQYLKVLDISLGFPWFCYKSIGYFKHLRYLSLCQPNLRESVCELYNLQTLKNKGFAESKFQMDLCRLINLKHLIVPNRYNLISMPAGISRLRNLETLPVFAVCNGRNCSSLAELKDLNNIKGELCINQLHHVTCGAEEAF